MPDQLIQRRALTATTALAVLVLLMAACQPGALSQSADATVARVGNRKEFVDAVNQGMAHIIVVDHIDLDGPGDDSCIGNARSVCLRAKLIIQPTTLTIQVRGRTDVCATICKSTNI
jgi:hypothetical protein